MRSTSRRSVRMRATSRRAVEWFALLVLFGLMFLPILTLARASVSPRVDLYSRPFRWLPQEWTWQHYLDVLRPDHIVPLVEALRHTFIVSLGTALLSVGLGSLAAYAFARLQFRGRNALLSAMFAVYILPGMLFLIPIFIMFREINILDSYGSLIVPYTAFIMPFIVIIMRGYFASIPRNLEEAAMLDGCSPFQIYLRIVLPLSTPGLVAAFVSAFILSWNEFLTPLILTSRLRVITTTLGQYSSTQDIELGQMAAAGMYSLLPVVVIALALNRYIRRGLVEGAVKG